MIACSEYFFWVRVDTESFQAISKLYLTGIRHGGIKQVSEVMQERTGGQNAAIAGGKTNN